MIAQRGWRQVVGFQTRNPLHRAHEYIQKVALETHDGLILHPLVGYTKSDDVPLDVRWQAYQILLDQYFPKERTLLTGFPAPMRYAGPREAVFHALCRKNYGITHFIVGRDHAGVSNFYDPQASQKIFERFNQAELGISIITADPAFYCHRCQQMATARSCPHDAVDHEVLSGTRIRTTLGAGGNLPPVAIRPEVEVILQQYYRTPL
jgi:sulfate adenylyltransferase